MQETSSIFYYHHGCCIWLRLRVYCYSHPFPFAQVLPHRIDRRKFSHGPHCDVSERLERRLELFIQAGKTLPKAQRARELSVFDIGQLLPPPPAT